MARRADCPTRDLVCKPMGYVTAMWVEIINCVIRNCTWIISQQQVIYHHTQHTHNSFCHYIHVSHTVAEHVHKLTVFVRTLWPIVCLLTSSKDSHSRSSSSRFKSWICRINGQVKYMLLLVIVESLNKYHWICHILSPIVFKWRTWVTTNSLTQQKSHSVRSQHES